MNQSQNLWPECMTIVTIPIISDWKKNIEQQDTELKLCGISLVLYFREYIPVDILIIITSKKVIRLYIIRFQMGSAHIIIELTYHSKITDF